MPSVRSMAAAEEADVWRIYNVCHPRWPKKRPRWYEALLPGGLCPENSVQILGVLLGKKVWDGGWALAERQALDPIRRPSWRDLQKKREALLDERAAVYRAQSTAQAVTRPTGDPVAPRREWEDLGRELVKHPEGSFMSNLLNSRRAELAGLFRDHQR
jgi:hypothetical protein